MRSKSAASMQPVARAAPRKVVPSSLALSAWLEVKVGSVFVDDVGPAPRIVADELPLVARAAVVLGEQDVARVDGERRTRLRLEFERAGQGDDERRDRILVPLV
jgi:hypothetical protein